MKSSRIASLMLILLITAGCGGSGSSGGASPPTPTGDNVLSITVNGSLCSANSYINKPCVSLTICTPGTSTCQTISDILLDTGDAGIRIFKQVLTVPLTQAASGSGSLAECITYADGSKVWGPVKSAGVVLGNEPAVTVPVQVIDSTFGDPTVCPNAFDTPANAGYNGTLGLSFFAQDCGPACRDSALWYYTCTGPSCTATTAQLADQVQNPVSLLPLDNNGVAVQLPSVAAGGALSINGYLILGIGTRSNNIPSGVTAYPADPNVGEFTTTLSGTTYPSFIDTGSNGLFFPSPSPAVLPECVAFPGWYCPSSTQTLTATNRGYAGSPSGTVSFQIANFDSLIFSPNYVFSNIGGSNVGQFDWGLPFHFGRTVYIGIENTPSSLGTGPYWAY